MKPAFPAYGSSTPSGSDTPTGSAASTTPKTPALINTTSATSRIMHPPEDISLEERRATLPQYRPNAGAASLGGMMPAGMVAPGMLSSPLAAVSSADEAAVAPAPSAALFASSMAAAAAAAAAIEEERRALMSRYQTSAHLPHGMLPLATVSQPMMLAARPMVSVAGQTVSNAAVQAMMNHHAQANAMLRAQQHPAAMAAAASMAAVALGQFPGAPPGHHMAMLSGGNMLRPPPMGLPPGMIHGLPHGGPMGPFGGAPMGFPGPPIVNSYRATPAPGRRVAPLTVITHDSPAPEASTQLDQLAGCSNRKNHALADHCCIVNPNLMHLQQQHCCFKTPQFVVATLRGFRAHNVAGRKEPPALNAGDAPCD
ncbi:Hypothetical predicted protein [Cloeon dipterum]|uniref:Uncharacterized protein n=1 Tax=Cloeon dipterum TaxID=197152 RepID=A0A8S1DDA0_9INSE|nr:Hypothetical predicted protein [Cloeon dipterum]